MGCDCKQGYIMPGVNRTPCGCQKGYTGAWNYGLGRLMGAIPQSLPPVAQGAPFTFDFNEPAITATQLDPADIPGWLEDAGVSYGNTASQLAGWIHPYIRVQGYSINYYDDGAYLAMDIQNAISAQDPEAIDPNTINFNVTPYYPPGYTPPPAQVGTPPATASTQQPSPNCPPGYYDNGWFTVNCVPLSQQSGGFDLTSLGLGAGGGAVLTLGVIGVLAIVIFAKR